MRHPIATLHMENGADIVIELLPWESAPNTVNSFLFAASHGYLDHHAIEAHCAGKLGGYELHGIWTQGNPVSDSK